MLELVLAWLVHLAHVRHSEAAVMRAYEALNEHQRYVELDALSDEIWHDRAFLADKPALKEVTRNLRLGFLRLIFRYSSSPTPAAAAPEPVISPQSSQL